MNVNDETLQRLILSRALPAAKTARGKRSSSQSPRRALHLVQ